VGATTQAGKLSGPLRDRFGLTQHLEFYTPTDLAAIVLQAAKKLDIHIEKDAAQLLGERSRKTARVALKLLKRVRDYAQIEGEGTISVKEVKETLKILGVDDLGLDASDRKLLMAIIEKFAGGPVGLTTLAAATAEDVGTIEDVYEPFLMQIGLLSRTNRGRMVTTKTYEYFGIPAPAAV
jgi:Holliday junction DNA helicase RuvB